MLKFYFDIPNKLNVNEKDEIYETLLYGFIEKDNILIVDDIMLSDYVILHQSYFKFNKQIIYPNKTIIIDMADSRDLLTDVKCFLYFKRSCIDKKIFKFIKYSIDIIPISIPIKKSYIEYLQTINLDNRERKNDICCTHLEIPDNHPCNLNMYRTKIVRYLKNLEKITSYKFYLGYDKSNISKARANLDENYFNTLLNSKIIITCNPDWWDGDYRLWESLASGALVICDKMLTPVIHPLEHKKHLIYYDRENIEELSSLIDYYLENENERLKIAKEGHEYALKYHKYSDRANEIINKLK